MLDLRDRMTCSQRPSGPTLRSLSFCGGCGRREMRTPSGRGHESFFFRWVRHSVYDDVHMDELAPTERSLSSTFASCRNLSLATRSSGQKELFLLIGAQPLLLVNRCIADAWKEIDKDG